MIRLVHKRRRPDGFRHFTSLSLLRDYDFLEETVKRALPGRKNIIDHRIICRLNNDAVVEDDAGTYRKTNIRITNSKHSPPEYARVRRLMNECIRYISANWEKKSSVHLAAYALWRLSWIHPFTEGNGRTARAVCLLIICLKHGVWLRGRTGGKQVRGSRKAYYDALLAADKRYGEDGIVDVSALELYLNTLLFRSSSRQLLRGEKA